tara:strand:+ start:324 stop:491 length:168 start_codon:yes stop_codon:yes gene_type:complete
MPFRSLTDSLSPETMAGPLAEAAMANSDRSRFPAWEGSESDEETMKASSRKPAGS